MFHRILVPTDGSPLSDKAINAAVEFAGENSSEIVALSVAEPYMHPNLFEGSMSPPTDWRESGHKLEKLAQLRVEKIAELARAKNISCKTAVVLSFSPYEEIVEATKRFDCDVIFMATHDRKGLEKLFVGSETQKVIAHSAIPVLVFR